MFNQVEKLNKHPSLFTNYLRVLATQKGMGFTIDQEGNKEEVKTKEPRANYRLQAILQAKDIDGDEYERLTRRKKAGKNKHRGRLPDGKMLLAEVSITEGPES